MFESQSVASDTINSKYNKGGGCMEAFHRKYVNWVSCMNHAQNRAPYSKSPTFSLQFLFLFQFQLSCPYAALGQELVQTLGLFSPLETFHPAGAGFNSH